MQYLKKDDAICEAFLALTAVSSLKDKNILTIKIGRKGYPEIERGTLSMFLAPSLQLVSYFTPHSGKTEQRLDGSYVTSIDQLNELLANRKSNLPKRGRKERERAQKEFAEAERSKQAAEDRRNFINAK